MKSEEKWLKLGKVVKSGKNGEEWRKVVKSGEKLEKVGKVGKSWNKWGNVWKSGEKQ